MRLLPVVVAITTLLPTVDIVDRAVSEPRSIAMGAIQQRKATQRKTTTKRPVARTPVVRALNYTTPRTTSALTSDLAYMLSSRTRHGQWGAIVVSLTRGDTLFSQGADVQMMPASTMKIVVISSSKCFMA